MATFEFEIHTGDEYLAGTDSNIFVVFQGVLGKSHEYRLNGNIEGNAFERNQTDKFKLEVDDEEIAEMGEIYAIYLRSDMMYAGAEWLLDTIKIKTKTQTIKFKISEWIKDAETKTYYDPSQIKKKDVKVSEHNVESEAEYFVPADTKITMEDSLQTKIGFHIAQTQITDTLTSKKLSITGGSEKSIKAAVEFALQTDNKVEKSEGITAEVTNTCVQKVELPVKNIAKKYKAMYIIKNEDYSIQIGNLTLNVPNTVSQKAAGFKEV